jgi:assimilatory nitrate reductase catalytic subunit
MAESDDAPLRKVTTTDDQATHTHCHSCAPRSSTPVDGRTAAPRANLAQQIWPSPDRVTTPLRRAHLGAPLEPCTWDEALDTIAAKVNELQAAHGPEAIAVLTGEQAYRLGRRASEIDDNGRFCRSSAAAALNRAFGMDQGLPGPISDVTAADVIFLVGGDIAETTPPFLRHLNNQRAAGGALIVADPRRTSAARQADLHLQLTPGTDLALANGLLHLAIAEGLLAEDYIGTRTHGFDAVRTKVNSYWPERVERITGVPVSQLRAAVRMLAAGQRAMILTARRAGQAQGADTVTAFINLALGLGLPGTEGSGFGCITGPGGHEADRLPGYGGVHGPAGRADAASLWGVHPDVLPGPGRSAYELLMALGPQDDAKALLLFGSDPVVSAPQASAVEDRLNELDLLVVADVVLSETAKRADVVLPIAQWAGESPTGEHTPSPQEGLRSDLEILSALDSRLEVPGATSAEPGEVVAGGLLWPCPETAEEHLGTPRSFLDGFATPDGRARFTPVDHRGPDEEIDSEYPVYLTTGRIAWFGDGPQEWFVELNPDLAERLGVTEGDMVKISSRGGASVASVRLTDTIRADTVFMPFHWAGPNTLTDSISRMPEVKVCAVRVEPEATA